MITEEYLDISQGELAAKVMSEKDFMAMLYKLQELDTGELTAFLYMLADSIGLKSIDVSNVAVNFSTMTVLNHSREGGEHGLLKRLLENTMKAVHVNLEARKAS